MDKYLTIHSSSEGFLKAKGSKFHAYAWPVFSDHDIKTHLEGLKEIHPKAKHHCYAWRLGMTDDLYRMNDAGEPSGTAAKPIYSQIRSNNLRNILIVVVRYFGGTKLGVPGLISAYKLSAEEAIKNGTIVERRIKDYFSITFEYSHMNSVMGLLKKSPVNISEQNFGTDCFIKCSINQSDRENLILALEKIDGLKYAHLYTA